MKKLLIALAACAAFASAAHAESSVTLYGLIDTGIDYATETTSIALGRDPNGNPIPVSISRGHAYRMSSGVMQGSRWGLRGVEDLGNGLQAIFTLESGFDVNKGSASQEGKLFDRQAFVGLAGDFGSITVGRQNDSINDFVGPLAASSRGAGDFAAHPGDLDNLDGSYRINNAIKYTSANYEGLTFGGLYSVGGTAGNFAHNRVWSAGANYSNGPLAIGAAYLTAKNSYDSLFAYNLDDPVTSLNNINVAIDGFGETALSSQIATAGATYSFGALTAGATYSNVQFKDYIAVTPVGTTFKKGVLNSAEASLGYQFSPQFSGIIAANYTKSNSVAGKKGASYKQVNLGLDYLLSKRTDIYVLAAGQNASGTNSFGTDAVAQINGFSHSINGKQRVVRIGARHKF